MVVELLVAKGDSNNALGDQVAQAVPGTVGVAVIGNAVRHLVNKRQVALDLAQQQDADIGRDGTAVESNHHAGLP